MIYQTIVGHIAASLLNLFFEFGSLRKIRKCKSAIRTQVR